MQDYDAQPDASDMTGPSNPTEGTDDIAAMSRSELENALLDARARIETLERDAAACEPPSDTARERLASLLRIAQRRFASDQELLDFALHEAITLTKSVIGFIYFYDEREERFTLNTWSKDVHHLCTIVEKQTVYPLQETGCWGETVRRRKPILINDFQAPNPLKRGYPEGHAHLTRFLSLPIFQNEEIVAVVGVANKTAPYDETDIDQLALMMDSVWRILLRNKLERNYRNLFNQMDTGFAVHEIVTDAHGKPVDYIFLDVNPAFERLTSLGKDDIINKRVREVLPNTESIWIERYGRVALTGTPDRFEHYSQELDRHYSVIVYSPLLRQFAVLVEDVTSRKAFEREIVEARDRAEAANQAKNDFLALMSHELRTPLNGVFGMLQLLQTTELDAEQAEFVQIARKSSAGLLAIIQDILDFAKAEAGRLEVIEEPFDLHEIIEDARNNFLVPCQQKGLLCAIRIAPEAVTWLHGGKRRIRQILFNILGNAVKFTQSGSVALNAETIPRGEEVTLLVTVTDTGVGIDPTQLELVFTPFTQAEALYTRSHGGVGLGLGVVKKLLALLGGSLCIDSTPDAGTTVHIAVPCRRAAPSVADADAESAPQVHQARVLLVEDDPVNQVAMRTMLRKFGYDTLTAADGEEALALLAKEPVDLVLMDIQMPVLDGFETTRRLRASTSPERLRRLPIIALTAYALPGDRKRCLAAGMQDYLAKPVEYDALRTAIDKALRESAASRSQA